MFAAALAAALFVPADPPKELPEAAKKELKKLEGKWKVTKAATSQKEGDTDRDLFVTFEGNKMSLGDASGPKETFTITALDPATDPKCIDLLETLRNKQERTLEGVFKLDGDTLQLAFAIPKGEKSRPVGFDKPSDPGGFVWVMKRVKE